MERVDGHHSVGCSTFDEVLNRYHVEIYRFSVHLTRDRDAANDLYQESLRRAGHAFDEIEGATNYRTWLFAIATTTFLSAPRRRGSTGSQGKERAAEVQGMSPGRTDRLDTHILLREVDAFVAALPPQQRVALVQRKYHDLSYAEIAITLRCSEAAALAGVHEAVRTLRAGIGDRL